MALLIESAKAEASDSSLEVMLPFESDLGKQMFVMCVFSSHVVYTSRAHPPAEQSFS